MSKKISGAEYPLSKIFSSDFTYEIPKYQRPYAWTVDQASELFDDLYDFYQKEPEEGYFLGSIVLIKEEYRPHSEVIDGQQRLTTLTILLAALASIMDEIERADMLLYLREPGKKFEGLEARPRLILRERDQQFFNQFIQNLKFDALAKLDPASLAKEESKRNIRENALLILDRIQKNIGEDASKLKEFVEFLLQRCYLVVVSTPSQQSAFRVFSVMNSRGLDLQPTDIIKADVIGGIPEPEGTLYSERWEEMEVSLGRSGFNDLFAHIRMIYAKEKAKRALLEEFRNYVLTQIKTPKGLIDDVLEPYAYSFSIIRNANYEASAHAEGVNDFLKWLNRIDNSDWIPPAVCFLAKHKNEPDYVLWYFKKLERLAAYLHICAKNVNFRIERYARVLNGLEKPSSASDPIAEIELSPEEKAEMRTALDSEIYTLSARKRNYLILRLDSFLSDGAATYDHNILTIEHVLPQTVDPTSEWARIWPDHEQQRYWRDRLANLVPLNFRRNVKASNYDFEKKKSAYFGGQKQVSSFVLTTQVLATPTWSPDYLKQRQKELLGVLSENWEIEDNQ